MANDGDAWAGAAGAKVKLADVLETIERELGIAPSQAAAILRPALEGLKLRGELAARVDRIANGMPMFPSTTPWVETAVERGRLIRVVRRYGWQRVDWEKGTIEGEPILLDWAQVRDFVRENFHPAAAVADSCATVPSDPRPAGEPVPECAPNRTGAAGRPTSMHVVEREFERRCATQAVLPKLNQEAGHLASWLAEHHKDAPALTPKTIGNRLREKFNAHTAGLTRVSDATATTPEIK